MPISLRVELEISGGPPPRGEPDAVGLALGRAATQRSQDGRHSRGTASDRPPQSFSATGRPSGAVAARA
jgi:hypothetical protein